MDNFNLPKHIFSGRNGKSGHCQGIATDGKYMYYSFTTKLIKTDLEGNFIGSVIGITGHLGCIAWDDKANAVVGSLEFKNDGIGKGILKSLGMENVSHPDSFYLVKFDVSKIDRADIQANSGVMTSIRLPDVSDDYLYCENGVVHKYGCSGIDGTTVIPSFNGRRVYMIAYGIYGDINRTDNDDQVLLCLDWENVQKDFKTLTLGEGGGVRGEKYFARTGNTVFGVQNLEYDANTDSLMAAVYVGQKKEYPNYNMFFIDYKNPYTEKGVNRLPLCEIGEKHPSGICGSRFKHGATGMISFGNRYYYFGIAGGDATDDYTNIYLYKYIGDGNFEAVQ